MNYDFNKLVELVRPYEDEKRFAHTLAVVREAEYLAEYACLDEDTRDKVKIAALMHDITKRLSEEEHRAIAQKYGFTLECDEPTMHEKTGAYFAREVFGDIIDGEIFSMISSHTTGKPNMSVPEMIVFIADYTEETRKHGVCRDTREYLHGECEKIGKNKTAGASLLREVTKRIMRSTLIFLLEKDSRIDIGTIAAWNDILREF